MAGTFVAQVDAWVAESKRRMEVVFSEACLDLAEEVTTPVAKGGNMPVDTGFLRASLLASAEGPAPIRPDAKPEKGSTYQPSGQVALVIAATKIGEKLWMTFTAAYARRLEYGFVGQDSLGRTFNQRGYGFVRLSAQRWQQLVNGAVQRVKSRVGGTSGP